MEFNDIESFVEFMKHILKIRKKASKAYINFSNINFCSRITNENIIKGMIFEQVNFTNFIVRRVALTFKHCTFDTVDFSNMSADRIIFEDCIFNKVIFTNAYVGSLRFNNCYIGETNMSDIEINNLSLYKIIFNNCIFTKAIIKNAEGAEVTFKDCINLPKLPYNCPEVGPFIGWKCALKIDAENYYTYVIVKLLITDKAKRLSSPFERKCRCNEAIVLEIQDLEGNILTEKEAEKVVSCFNRYTEYKLGEIVHPDTFDDDQYNVCSHGIHFFINRQEAVNYALF